MANSAFDAMAVASESLGTEIHRKATAQAIHKAMNNEPSIDWLLEHQEEITHKYYQKLIQLAHYMALIILLNSPNL